MSHRKTNSLTIQSDGAVDSRSTPVQFNNYATGLIVNDPTYTIVDRTMPKTSLTCPLQTQTHPLPTPPAQTNCRGMKAHFIVGIGTQILLSRLHKYQ